MRRGFHPVPSPCTITSMVSVATQTESNFVYEFDDVTDREFECSRLNSFDQPLSRLFQMEAAQQGWHTSHCRGFSNDLVDAATSFEEITLRKSHKEAKFGLTLWYETGNDVICQPGSEASGAGSRTKVYIGEIDSDGVAAKDGRAKIGDRILKINGESVESRDQVLQLLCTDLPFIRLLLSRPASVQGDDGFTDDLDILECLSYEDENDHQIIPLECIDEEDDATENDSQRQDSGVGKTDESTRNEESSEQEAIDDCFLSPQTDNSFRCGHQKSSDSFASIDCHESDPDAPLDEDELPSIFHCQQFYEMLKERCDADFASKSTNRNVSASASINQKVSTVYDDYAVLERPRRSSDEMLTLGRHMAALYLERPSNQTNRYPYVARKVPRMGTKIDFSRQLNTSATPGSTAIGGGGGAAAAAAAAAPFGRPRRNDPLLHMDRKDISSTVYTGVRGSSNVQPDYEAPTMPSERKRTANSRESQMCQTDDDGEYELLHHHTGRIPADIVVHCFCRDCAPIGPRGGSENNPNSGNPGRDRKTKTEAAVPTADRKSSPYDGRGATQEQLEWVVKRRADGSRYITRRPVRNRLLKERARKVEEERPTTTDEETSSMLKTGKYWNRDDRKRHMERSRLRRREEAAARHKVLEGSVDDKSATAPADFVRLSRKKAMKCKGRRVLDDFTTLQELLAHGSRETPPNGRSLNQLLSVTTV